MAGMDRQGNWRARLLSAGLDLPQILGLAAIVVLTGGFLLLADEVMEGDTHGLDQAVLMAFRTPGAPQTPIGPVWLQEMGRDVTAMGSFAVLGLVVLAVVGHLLLSGRRRTALFITVSVLGGTLVSQLLKAGYDRPRPEFGAAAHEFTASFPSGHAMLSSLTYLTLGALLSRATNSRSLKSFYIGFAVLLTGLVGLSRLYLGVHYFTDVVGGWCLGAAWALLSLLVVTWISRRDASRPN